MYSDEWQIITRKHECNYTVVTRNLKKTQWVGILKKIHTTMDISAECRSNFISNSHESIRMSVLIKKNNIYNLFILFKRYFDYQISITSENLIKYRCHYLDTIAFGVMIMQYKLFSPACLFKQSSWYFPDTVLRSDLGSNVIFTKDLWFTLNLNTLLKDMYGMLNVV